MTQQIPLSKIDLVVETLKKESNQIKRLNKSYNEYQSGYEAGHRRTIELIRRLIPELREKDGRLKP